MGLELVTPLPPGAPSHTRLARHGERLVVLREIKDGTDCSWPPASPHLITLQEVGELQGKRHALFEWVPGVTLRDIVRALETNGSPIPLGVVGRVVIDAARALMGATPSRAHGGLQDAALQIGFDGVVSVLDWGAPRVSRFRPIGRVNFAADVFALGGVLHSTLTGFRGDYASPPVALAIPSNSHPESTPALDDLILRALSTQADARQPDVGALADELEAVLGEALLTTEQLSNLVGPLFRDRIKLIQSLGGFAPPTGPSREAELPMTPLSMGTQPSYSGPFGPPDAPPKKAQVPWDSAVSLPATEPTSEPTLPRVLSSELVPRAALPAEVEAPSEPTLPRINSSEVVPRAKATPELDHDEGAKTTLARPLRSTGAQHSPPPPDDTALRARPAPTEDTDPRARPDVGEDTNPRARPPAPADDTNPRARAPVEDTGPQLRVPKRPGRDDDDDDEAQGRAQNTTTHERLRARGQERLPTPPEGIEALGEEAALGEPTAVRKKLEVDPILAAATAQQLPRVADSEPSAAPVSGGGGLRIAMVLLLLVVVGLAVGVVLKLKREQERQQSIAEQPVVEEDAGTEQEPEADASVAMAAAEFDAGAPAVQADAGAPEVVDAGTAPGPVDAGVKAAKKPPKKPTKKTPPKKKKR